MGVFLEQGLILDYRYEGAEKAWLSPVIIMTTVRDANFRMS